MSELETKDVPFDLAKVPNFSRILFSFKVLYEGWDMDNDGWIVELTDGSRAIVMTSHGWTYIAKREEIEERLAEYKRVIDGTKTALALL